MVSQVYVSNSKKIQEILLTNLFGYLPTNMVGGRLRRLFYRHILRKIGQSVNIENHVKILNAACIEISNQVQIFRDVNLDARGNSNNRIYLADAVRLEQGVDIRALDNTAIEIGESTYIGPYVCIAGPGHIKIGKNCLIAAQAGLFANNHIYSDPTANINSQGVTREGIVIEDDCWLGAGVKVLDGVTIGEGSIIGAGAVVTKDIPPFSIAVGVPAKVIRSRKEYVSKDGNLRLPTVLSTSLAKLEKAAQVNYQHLQNINNIVKCDLLFQQLLNSICEVMKVDTVTILLPTEKKQQLFVCATIGLEEEIKEDIQIPFGCGFAGRIAASANQMIVDDLSTIEVVSPILRNRGIQSIIGVPLKLKDQLCGVLHVGKFGYYQFTNENLQQLQLVADCMGLAIEPLFTT
jgi:acetyltransferase-like isoleucine patch superfamily enzyme/putative methionine-R-sulfoxide reductase with GAF domain